ncbi:MAG: hypothetical protein PHR87_11500 [Sulfurospirillaceae bacterium]|nr:hypothetical protein [Sulfurospirillaceae bacterium]
MKKLHVIISLAALILFLTGCEKTLETPKVPLVDSTLPRIESVRTLADITEIGFEWSPIYGENIEGYVIYRLDGNKMKKIATIKDKYTSHYVDTKLTPDTQYSYRFATFSAEKRESEPSQIITVTTIGTIESVSFIKAITGLPNRVKLVWRPHPMERVESYIIERNEFKSTQWEEIGKIDGRLNAEFIDTGLQDNYVYRYRVKVKTFDGIISKPSEIVEAHTKPLPKTIGGLSATTDLPKKIIVKWAPASENDFSHYKIYRSSNASLFYSYHGKTKNTEFEDIVSDNGKMYYYKITAVDTDGLESKQQGNPISGSTLSALRAPIVQSVKHDGRSIFITWNNVDNAIKYNVLREFKSGGSVKKQSYTGVFENNYHDLDTVPGVEYTYHIVAIDKFGIASDSSDSVVITIPKD